jgi:nucleolar pre-ribosomal-associated protein 2
MAPPSLQRLLALEKNYTDLDQQIREARSILNLRKDWDTPESSVDFPGTFQGAQYHARAEWVLRWLLEKLKVDGTAGRQARGIVGAWNLLDCLITIIPAASAAVLLRAGDYTKSLEKALEENFGDDILDRAFRVDVGPQNGITASREPLESTVTAEELPETSRKRKRGTESESPVKKIGLSTGASKVLFYTIARSLEAVVASSYSTQGPAYKIVANHMRMVLRVDSANAAKLLKSWLNAIILILADSDARATILNATDGSMKLTPMLRIWEMRTPGVQDDTGASVDDFSEHCLLPVTILLGLVKDDETFTSLGEDVNVNKDHLAVARKAVIISLEQLYARHVFGPTRADFFATASSKTNPPSKGPTPGESPPVAMNLFRCLEHIRTRLTLAASLKRMEEPAPPSSDLLFRTIPHLLDVAIRCSPRLTPRTRISEKPWIQAVLVTLLDCTGFILKKQPFPAVVETIRSAEVMLQIIIDWKFPVDSNITKSMLRFPSGVQDNRDRQHRTIWWGLVAQLTALDPDMFLPEAKGAESTTIASSGMLRMVFRQISLFPQYALDSDREIQEEEQRAVTHDLHGLLTTSDTGTLTARVAFPRLIIIPIMKAFARNRDLLGFITRWRDQLRNTRSSTGDPSIWQSPDLISALASLLEVSLTIAQIKNLFEEHHNLLSSLLASLGSDDGTMAQMMSEDFFSTSNASTAMACILIQSLRLDDTVTALQETLKAVQSDLVALADVVAYRASADMTETWTALSLVFSVLWPLEADVYLDHPNDILNSTIIQLANVSIAPGRVNIWIVNSDLDISSRTAAFAFLVTVLDRLECISASQETIFQYLNQAMLVLMPSTMFKHGEVNKVSMALDDPFDRIDSTSSCEFRRCLERLLIGSPKLLV